MEKTISIDKEVKKKLQLIAIEKEISLKKLIEEIVIKSVNK